MQKLSAIIDSYENIRVNGKNVTYFNIKLETKYNVWVVQKRYNHFNELDQTLRKKYKGVPSLPGKTLFKPSATDRCLKLNTWCNLLFNNMEVMDGLEAREFFNVFFSSYLA